MKIIEVDEELYQFIASNTRSIGESASDILRRLLHFPYPTVVNAEVAKSVQEAAVDLSLEPVSENQTEQQLEVATQIESVAPVLKKQSEESVAHSVKRVRAVLESESFQQETKNVNRFLQILTALYRSNPEGFAQATETLSGRTRIYFARDEATLLAAGNHTKPKQIPETPYWVITNTNSARKMLMLEGAMLSMQVPQTLIEDVRHYFSA